jgi:pSer/pThr/pTyr-binding forkhead associated (FHA) protein
MSDSQDETARFADDLVPSDTHPLSPEDQAAIAALPKNSALLIALRGPATGSKFLLDQDLNLAGRFPNADVFLDDVTVSRRHVEFARSPQGFILRDLGSMNGTYVNGSRVDQADLKPGDEILIGKYRLTFFAGGQS